MSAPGTNAGTAGDPVAGEAASLSLVSARLQACEARLRVIAANGGKVTPWVDGSVAWTGIKCAEYAREGLA